MDTSHNRPRVVSGARICYAGGMTGLLPGTKLRAMAALIAAYAIALQAVFTMLAPMQVQADGSVTVDCSGSAAVQGPDDPAVPAPATGKLQCVLCGACAAGTAILPGVASPAYLTIERPVTRARESSRDRLATAHLRGGPARAPPLTV
jgi:hypothetical protein